jgi:hypothetical protein
MARSLSVGQQHEVKVIYLATKSIKGTICKIGVGSKCVDRAYKEGLKATTSPGGARAWRKKLAKYYKGKDVIVIADNDEPGRDYARQVMLDIVKFAKSVKAVVLAGLTKSGQDIYDWFEMGHTKEELLNLCVAAPEWKPDDDDGEDDLDIDGDSPEESSKRDNGCDTDEGVDKSDSDDRDEFIDEEAGDEPTSKEYNVFFEDRLNGPQKDILSDELMALVNGTWQPAASRLDILGSYAFDSFLFKKSRLKEHLARFAETKTPRLLIDIPMWDGVDRVKQIADCVTVTNCTSNYFYELLCDWGARLFRRIENPKNQNRVFVLQGPQGIGKDFLIDAIVEGFGQFTANLTITSNERDTQAAVGSLIVAKISEFDRTARAEISTLKDLITREHTFIRLPYDRAAKIRAVRCSFMASVNVTEILRDHTGNRRFIIFNLEKINWNYPVGQSLQILAQFKHLAETNYMASQEAEAAMKTFIGSQTPDDPKEAILEAFDERIRNLEAHGRWEFSSSEVFPVMEDIVKSFGYKANTILHMLKMNGRSKRKNTGMVYFRKRD